ncbi:hypothetical protein TRIATDRAFT_259618 [Trichoderma atroviride IMI 206040]|uniref:Uncharacterized protein n=1 Tax=Hypocrea atroviridis (strain ATCC 20476 / IMI 206040) TaxID=452589 RepID=G9P498_HYPAI|nr:uncharacterized protein TRIATDRAFT_259618 [Trichoderma atroviride IMI 206040]EHK41942.1 hypothetical protein TRIATDRAFT_259618 [Trichoderma atroviride IMI 206040]
MTQSTYLCRICIALWATVVLQSYCGGSLCSSQDAKSGTTEISPATIKPSSTAGVPNHWAWESIAAYT